MKGWSFEVIRSGWLTRVMKIVAGYMRVPSILRILLQIVKIMC
jgi:hypothetical protein